MSEAEGCSGKIIADRRVHRRIVSIPVTRLLGVQIQTFHQTITWNYTDFYQTTQMVTIVRFVKCIASNKKVFESDY